MQPDGKMSITGYAVARRVDLCRWPVLGEARSRTPPGSAVADLVAARLPAAEWITLLIGSISYLLGLSLVELGKSSIAVSVKTGVPLSSTPLGASLCMLPWRYKLFGVAGGRLVRRILKRRFPAALLDRPKSRLGAPLERLHRIGRRMRAVHTPATIRKLWGYHRANCRDLRVPRQMRLLLWGLRTCK